MTQLISWIVGCDSDAEEPCVQRALIPKGAVVFASEANTRAFAVELNKQRAGYSGIGQGLFTSIKTPDQALAATIFENRACIIDTDEATKFVSRRLGRALTEGEIVAVSAAVTMLFPDGFIRNH